MSKQTRHNHSSTFKARVALAALKGDRTMAELSAHFGVHSKQIQQWKQQMQTAAPDVFETIKTRTAKDQGSDVKVLHAKIGELTMERDFLVEKLQGPAANN
ncbi:MAG: helix-turn-helix domain-containing protein [Gammaproteobacteria bacterium]|nr:helix-turn-helix domain-containing protein [Gammaproteobacteria bacterium]